MDKRWDVNKDRTLKARIRVKAVVLVSYSYCFYIIYINKFTVSYIAALSYGA